MTSVPPSDPSSPDTRDVRVGLIGCGAQGNVQLAGLAAIDGVEIAAIADLDEARLAETGERFGVAQRHGDAYELLDLGLDLVSICTMPDTHRAFATRAFAAGSHVLCEKPLARDAAEGAEIVRAAERAGRLLMIGFNMRYMGAAREVRRFVDEGLLGELVCARGFMLSHDVPWWGRHYVREISGGGTLNSAGVHMLDLLMWLAGNPRPQTATASMATVFPRKRADGAPEGAAGAYDVEDLVFGHVRFEGGFWLSIESTWMNDRLTRFGFDAFGTRGQAHLEPLELYTARDGAPVRVAVEGPVEPDFTGGVGLELQDVVASVRAGRIAGRVATGRQALDVQAVVDALYRSAHERREVDVAPAHV